MARSRRRRPRGYPWRWWPRNAKRRCSRRRRRRWRMMSVHRPTTTGRSIRQGCRRRQQDRARPSMHRPLPR
eukprot:4957647-Heterocapsa_arctica.AAC.1